MTGRHTLTVAILTFKRPARLAQGLPAVLAHTRALSTDSQRPFTAEVLVVDNDPAGSARHVVEGLDATDVRYVVEPVPGISAGRNRALDETTGRNLLVYIDDDEEPQDGWLTELVDVWRRGEPGGVVGRVVSRLSDDVEPWVAAGQFFVRRRLPTGTEVPMAAAGNLLLDLDQVRPTGVRFSETLGLTGGEDSLFTNQLHRRGLRLVWCDESVTVDVVDVSRLDRRWVLRRARSHGNRFGLVQLILAQERGRRLATRVRLVGRGTAIIGTGLARFGWGVLGRSLPHRARGLWMTQRGRGMIAAALGVVTRDYAH